MQKQAGSILAAVPIWHEFMVKALENQPIEFFNKPEPVLQSKIMLNGEYISPEGIHCILYYVDKNDPLGPPPTNPENDPQFLNWELPVRLWQEQIKV